MKKILLLISFISSFVFCFGQPVSNRSNASITVQDARGMWMKNAYLPRYADTTTANISNSNKSIDNIGIDSCGAIIYTYSHDAFWIRKCFPVKHWELIQNGGSSSVLSNCGLKGGTGLISYDSLLTFDVTAALYALCCDMITRTTNFQTVILDTNSTDFQRYDLIVLDSNGLKVLKGTPATNPSTPQTDSCQIILTYVLINAHDSVPAFISPTNPKDLYDENYDGEWIVDSTRAVTLDTANTTFPVHLLHSINISSFTPASNEFFLSTSTPIDLNSYTVLKFYVRRTNTSSQLGIVLSWYLDDVQQTFPTTATVQPTGGYQVFIIPLIAFRIINGTQVNRLKISIQGANFPFYIDWIQLQSGAIIANPATGGTVGSVGMGNLDSLLIPSTANPNTNPFTTFSKFNIPAYRVLINNASTTGPYVWGQIDYSTSVGVGRLPLLNLQLGTDGNYFGTEGGVNQSLPFELDTTFVGNWLVRRTDPNSNNDTLYFGYSKRDSALLSATTYASLNGHDFIINNGVNDLFRISTDTVLTIIKSNDVGVDVISNLGSATIGDVNNGALFEAQGNASGEVAFQATVGGAVLNGTSFSNSAIIVLNFSNPTITAQNEGGGLGMNFITNGVTNNDVIPIMSLDRSTDITGTVLPVNGVGSSIDVKLATNASGVLSSTTATQLISAMTDVTQATAASKFSIKNVFGGSLVSSFTVNGDGSWDIRPITATQASAITPTEGKIVFVSNTNGTFLTVGFWGYQGGLWVKM